MIQIKKMNKTKKKTMIMIMMKMMIKIMIMIMMITKQIMTLIDKMNKITKNKTLKLNLHNPKKSNNKL